MKKSYIILTVWLIVISFAATGCSVFASKSVGSVGNNSNKPATSADEKAIKDKLKKIGLEYTSNEIYFDGKPTYFWSGEFPYYRIDANEWEDRLEKVKQAGVKFITAYIPWNLHEYEEGKFDFTGKGYNENRDLVKFLQLISKKGMYFIPKPGPFICAEVQHGGIPDWLTDKHPEIIMKDEYGTNVGFRQDGKPLPDMLNETYMKYVNTWYDTLAKEVLSKYQYPNGPIVAMQVENEMIYSTGDLVNPFSWGYTDSTKLLYEQWLEQQYKDIAEYNRLHGTKYSSYKEINQPKSSDWGFKNKESWLVYQDWITFMEYYGAETLNRYAAMLTKSGMTVPFYHNAGMVEDEGIMSFQEISKTMWLGVNFWMSTSPMNSFESYIVGMRRMRQLKGSQLNRPSIAPEMNWGWGSAGEFDFLARYTLPYLRGTNIYTIVDGDKAGNLNGRKYTNNPEPFPGSSPIDAKGNVRPAYKELMRLTGYVDSEISSFGPSKPLSDITLGFYTSYNQIFTYRKWSKMDDFEFTKLFGPMMGANEFLQDFMRTFIEKDMDCDTINIQSATLEELQRSKMLVVVSQSIMDESTQEKLVKYVENGGKLVLMPSLPTMNLKLESSTILRDKLLKDLKISETKAVKAPFSITWKDYTETLKGGYALSTIEGTTGEDKVLATNKDGKNIAVERKFGKGKVFFIGTYIQDSRFYDWLGNNEGVIGKYAYSDNENVEVVPAGSSSTGDIYLFITNRDKKAQKVEIKYVDLFNNNKLESLSTSVAAQSCSIIKVNGTKVVSASLNGDFGSSATIGGKGLKTDKGVKVDFYWMGDNSLKLSSDRITGVEIDLAKDMASKSIEIVDVKGNKIPFEVKDGVLKFKYTPVLEIGDSYTIDFK